MGQLRYGRTIRRRILKLLAPSTLADCRMLPGIWLIAELNKMMEPEAERKLLARISKENELVVNHCTVGKPKKSASG